MDVAVFQRGVRLFKDGEFFAAHEALEEVWRDTAGPQKKFFQGLIQIAVAFHHYGCGNSTGARSLLARAARNLDGCPENFCGICLSPLLHSLAQWQESLKVENAPPPPLPTL